MDRHTNATTGTTSILAELLRAALDRQTPTTTIPTSNTDPITQTIDIAELLNIINTYTQNINMYNRNINMYNRNIQSLFNMLVQLGGQHTIASAVLDLGTVNLQSLFNNPLRPTGNYNNETTRLTQQDIQRCTETIQYRQGNSAMTETRCPIGLTNFQENEEVMRIRRCGHYFNPANLRNWLVNHNNCPVCRRLIVGGMTDDEMENILNSVEIESDSEIDDDDDDHQ
jgi:hypothetical protein